MSTSIRELYGMEYKAVEFEHSVNLPMSAVLRKLADWCEENNMLGLPTGIYTESHPDDESKFLTNFIWAIY